MIVGASKKGPASSMSRPKECANGRKRKRPPLRMPLPSKMPIWSTLSSMESMLPLVWMTPLGGPVVPEV